MASFKDTAGRDWRIKLDFDLQRRVRQATGLKLQAEGFNSFAELSTNMDKLAETLWLAVEKQAGERGVTKDGFWSALDGTAMHAGELAIREAAIEFAPAGQRDAFREAFKQLDAAMSEAYATACERIQSATFNPEAA